MRRFGFYDKVFKNNGNTWEYNSAPPAPAAEPRQESDCREFPAEETGSAKELKKEDGSRKLDFRRAALLDFMNRFKRS